MTECGTFYGRKNLFANGLLEWVANSDIPIPKFFLCCADADANFTIFVILFPIVYISIILIVS